MGFKDKIKGRRQSSNVIDTRPPKEYSNMSSDDWIDFKTKVIADKASKSPVPTRVVKTTIIKKGNK